MKPHRLLARRAQPFLKYGGLAITLLFAGLFALASASGVAHGDYAQAGLAVAGCLPFGMLFSNPPDDGKGGGGGGNPTGTLEERLTAALNTLGTLTTERDTARSELATRTSERDSAQSQATTLQGQFDALTNSANDLRTQLTTAQADVTRLTAEAATAKNTLTLANANVSRLEKLCGVQGVDPNKAVPTGGTQPQGTLTVADYDARIRGAKTPAEQAAITKEFEKAHAEGRIA